MFLMFKIGNTDFSVKPVLKFRRLSVANQQLLNDREQVFGLAMLSSNFLTRCRNMEK